MSARIQRVEDKNGNAVGETLPLKIERLERENAALAHALQIERECVVSLTRDNGVLLQAADATKSGSLAVSQAGQIEHLERENAALKQRILDDNKAYGCEMRAWSGTIWDHAKQLQDENNALRAALIRARLYVCWGDEDKNYPAVIKRVTEDRAFIDAALGKEAQP